MGLALSASAPGAGVPGLPETLTHTGHSAKDRSRCSSNWMRNEGMLRAHYDANGRNCPNIRWKGTIQVTTTPSPHEVSCEHDYHRSASGFSILHAFRTDKLTVEHRGGERTYRGRRHAGGRRSVPQGKVHSDAATVQETADPNLASPQGVTQSAVSWPRITSGWKRIPQRFFSRMGVVESGPDPVTSWENWEAGRDLPRSRPVAGRVLLSPSHV